MGDGDTTDPAAPPGGRASLPRRVARWFRTHGPQTLAGAALIAVLGAVTPVVVQQLWPSGSGSPAAPAATATGPLSCRGAHCWRIDPEKAGCDAGETTLARRTNALGVTLWLRYSARCAAAWSRITGATVGDGTRIEEAVDTGVSAVATITSNFDVYTPMVPATGSFRLRACAVPDDSTGTTHWARFCVEATPADLPGTP
jgi:Protein of unknown function (DUF2690)